MYVKSSLIVIAGKLTESVAAVPVRTSRIGFIVPSLFSSTCRTADRDSVWSLFIGVVFEGKTFQELIPVVVVLPEKSRVVDEDVPSYVISKVTVTSELWSAMVGATTLVIQTVPLVQTAAEAIPVNRNTVKTLNNANVNILDFILCCNFAITIVYKCFEIGCFECYLVQ